LSKTEAKTARELFDDCIKTEWPALFRKDGGEVHVRKTGGSRYVPTQWAVGLLKEDVNAWDAAIAAWSTPNEDAPVSGYDRIIAEAGPEYTWEGILIEPSRPWAAELRSKHPEVVRNIEADLERRAKGVVAWRAQRQAETEQLALEQDEATIAVMNAKRVAEGRQPLSEQQAQMVRDQRRQRREAANQA
jgi:hypothetical protein